MKIIQWLSNYTGVLLERPSRRRSYMGAIQCQSGKGQAANQITQSCRDFIPDEVVSNGEVTAHDHCGREQEHVNH